MAQLPPDGQWIMQQIDGEVVLFERYTEIERLRFDPTDANATAKAQQTIHQLFDLSDEQRCFAHFWAGYFYAHAGGENASINKEHRHQWSPTNLLVDRCECGETKLV